MQSAPRWMGGLRVPAYSRRIIDDSRKWLIASGHHPLEHTASLIRGGKDDTGKDWPGFLGTADMS